MRKQRLERAAQPIEAKRERARGSRWLRCRADGIRSSTRSRRSERRAVLEALRERMLERNYINNLLAGIERETRAHETAESTPRTASPCRPPESCRPRWIMSKVVGIDLGTTNSLVAYVKDGVPLVIRDEPATGWCHRLCRSRPMGRSTSAVKRSGG